MSDVMKKIDLPVHTLAVGLRNQDITKVSSFCKEADNVFVRFLQRVDHLTNTSTPQKTSIQNLHYHEATLEMYRNGLNKIITTAKDYIQRSQHISFMQHVLQLVQDHLSRGVKQVMTNLQKVQVGNLSNRIIEKQSDVLLTLITDIMLEIRELSTQVKRILQVYQQRQQQHQKQKQSAQASGRERRGSGSSVLSFLEGAIGGGGTSNGGSGSATHIEGPVTDAQRQMIMTWDSLDERAVIVEGILAGEIQFLQKYQTQRYGPDSAEWMHIINTGLSETLIFLQEKEVTYASQMLQNMGFDVRTKLRQICLYTTERNLRDYLAQELQSLNALTEDEVSMLKFVHKMEELYSCPSFKVAKLLRTEGIIGEPFPDPINLQDSLPESKFTHLAEEMCGDIVDMDIQNSQTGHYSHTLLEWVRCWDQETRQRILIDQALHRKAVKADMVEDIPAVVIWNYLCTRQNVCRLREWIDAQHPLKNQEVPVEPIWPYNHPISKEMIDNMMGATELTSEELLNEFARRGLFNTHEQESFECLLSRLRKVQGILEMPHIIEKSDDPLMIGMQDFHRHMLQFCIEKNMPELLYFYLDYWSLCAASSNLDQFHLEDSAPLWVEMLLHFRNASKAHFDPNLVFVASLSTSKCIQKLNLSSVSALIEEGLIGTALATLMYSTDRLKQFLENPPEKAKHALMNLPTLYQALFNKDVLTNHSTISTVYQLFSGNIPFESSRLFGWQSTNQIISEETMKELPHFAREDLASKYGHKESLQFTYFLKQGRPCFAFSNFVLQEVQQSGSVQLSPKRIEKACLKVHCLGIKYFHKPQITAACAMFMEMLGQDSTVFRVHIQSANLILMHKIAGFIGSIEEKKHAELVSREQVSSSFQNCLRQKEKYVKETLKKLEAATKWHIAKKHIQRASHEAEHKWLLALTFCRCHGLPYTTIFLEDCAKEDDWLRFLTHAQTYQYLPYQVKEVVPHFYNSIIREHMRFIMNNMNKTDENLTKKRDRETQPQKDFRARLYARVGVSKGVKDNQSSTDDDELEMSSLEYQHTVGQGTDVTSDTDSNLQDPYNVDIRSDNLFDLLLACQKTPYPAKILCRYGVLHRNSVLPVLAACFPDSNLLECLCTWLKAALSVNVIPSTSDTTSNRDQVIEPQVVPTKRAWALADLFHLVHKGLETSQMVLVYDGFYIFFPNTVILPFLRCIAKFYQQEDLPYLKSEVDSFKQKFDKLKLDGENLDSRRFPLVWLQELALSVLNHMICHLSDDNVGKFLQLLDESNIMKIFIDMKNVPDISLLHRLHLQTKNAEILINFHQLLSSTEKDKESLEETLSETPFQKEWHRIVGELQQRGFWNEARVAAELVGMPAMDITLNQLNTDIQNLNNSGVWDHSEVQSEFWTNAETLLSRHEVDPVIAAKFFQEHADHSCRSSSKEHLYQLAYNWLSKASTETSHSLELFTHIWRAKIRKTLEKDQTSESEPIKRATSVFTSKVNTSFDQNQLRKLEKLATTPMKDSNSDLLTPEEKGALGCLFEQLLDEGRLLEVMKVANHFSQPCQDLNIISTCHKLASGDIAPEALDVATKKLIANSKGTSRTRKTSLQMVTLPRVGSRLSISSQMSELGDVYMVEDNVLSCVQLLSQQCTHGKHCCDFILVTYQAAKMLEIEYKEALAVDEFSLLSHIIKSDLPTKYMLAKSFIQASCIPDAQVAGFLCNIVVDTLQIQLGIMPASDVTSQSTIPRSGSSPSRSVPSGGLSISEIIQLCHNPATLGQRLLTYVVSMNSSEVDSNVATLSLEVELLIYAHDCFTVACYMEGISDLLRTCRSVAQLLDHAEEYNLMVRLLTSVGRYSEMVYIFDILKQQHQFELLFRKGTDKESKLKLAILDYLQRYHSDDTDTYTMVALHFTMYREIAQMLQKAAKKQLNDFQGKLLENSAENQAKLQKALHYLSDAAESYVKENCLRHAEECVRTAKLVALQIQYLPAKIRVINLDTDGVRMFVRTHKKVHEVHIVLEAYNQNNLWSEALYNQLIKQGDFRYLNDVKLYVKITPNIVTDIAERFKSEGHHNKPLVSNMRKLLLQCPDKKTALVLANNLDMKETAVDIMKGPGGAFLKDCTLNKTV